MARLIAQIILWVTGWVIGGVVISFDISDKNGGKDTGVCFLLGLIFSAICCAAIWAIWTLVQ